MKIFKDLFSGDELFSDTYTFKEIEDGCIYEVTGKMTTETTDTANINIGANASEEAPDEGCEASSSQSGVDIVLANRLVEASMDKKAVKAHLLTYMKQLKTRLEENEYAEIEKFKKSLNGFVQKVLKEFKEYQFFLGESMSPEGQLILMRWEGETPYLYFIKQGLEEEKV